MDTIWQDLRFGFRTLIRNPATSALALLTLALGIGANTALFSVVNGVLLRPLPYPDPAELVVVQESNPGRGFPRFSVSPPPLKPFDSASAEVVFELFSRLVSEGKTILMVTQDERLAARMREAYGLPGMTRAQVLRRGGNVLLLDEPTTYLDMAHQLEVLQLLDRLNRTEGRTVLMVLHDLNNASRYSHRMIALKDGAVFAAGRPEEVVTRELLRGVFGVEEILDLLRERRLADAGEPAQAGSRGREQEVVAEVGRGLALQPADPPSRADGL